MLCQSIFLSCKHCLFFRWWKQQTGGGSLSWRSQLKRPGRGVAESVETNTGVFVCLCCVCGTQEPSSGTQIWDTTLSLLNHHQVPGPTRMIRVEAMWATQNWLVGLNLYPIAIIKNFEIVETRPRGYCGCVVTLSITRDIVLCEMWPGCRDKSNVTAGDVETINIGLVAPITISPSAHNYRKYCSVI